MKAFALSAQGEQPAHIEIDTPEPDAGEARVRVSAASINGFDVAVAAGYMAALMEHRYPVVLGREFSGVVDALGVGVDSLSVGDRVFGIVAKPHLAEGAFAEYTTVSADGGLAITPASLSDAQGASLAHTGTNALAALAAIGDATGKTVLVVGATGGVGTLLVQLLASAGAQVIATGRTKEGRALLTELGAAHAVDYQTLGDAVHAIAPEGVDAAVHLNGDPAEIAALVKDGGTFVSLILYTPEMFADGGRLTFVPVVGYATSEGLRSLANKVEAGELRVIVDREHTFDEVGAALGAYGRETVGNIVIHIN